MEDTVVLERPRLERPVILDEILKEVDEASRKEELVKQKRSIETNIMSSLANIRVQEDILELKERALDDAPDSITEQEEQMRIRAIDQARLELEDRYQGGVALANELRRTNKALNEIKNAGVAAFENTRAGRRARTKS